MRCDAGAPTSNTPQSLALESDRISAPMTLKFSAPLVILSSDPRTYVRSAVSRAAADRDAAQRSLAFPQEMRKKSSITSPGPGGRAYAAALQHHL